MPELPEVETVRRGLSKISLQQTITQVEVLLGRTIAAPDPEGFGLGLQGNRIQSWQRRGKYLLAELVNPQGAGGWWGVHLRMTGQLLWLGVAAELAKHTRVRIYFGGDRSQNTHELRFVDTRSFGQMWWVPPGVEPASVMTGLQRLGPEPFSEAFSTTYLAQALKTSQRPIKNALLDQRLVAGVGNIYADEALFLSGIHPTTPAHRLNRPQLDRLRQVLIEVLETSIGEGGTTFSDFRNLEGLNGNYGHAAWVYGRTGHPCRHCQTAIARLKLAGRSTHFCPLCQPTHQA